MVKDGAKMEKTEVEKYLTENGWRTIGILVVSENKSKYIEWYKDDMTIYLGNWFIEIDKQPIAFPYKDKTETIETLVEFLTQ